MLHGAVHRFLTDVNVLHHASQVRMSEDCRERRDRHSAFGHARGERVPEIVNHERQPRPFAELHATAGAFPLRCWSRVCPHLQVESASRMSTCRGPNSMMRGGTELPTVFSTYAEYCARFRRECRNTCPPKVCCRSNGPIGRTPPAWYSPDSPGLHARRQNIRKILGHDATVIRGG